MRIVPMRTFPTVVSLLLLALPAATAAAETASSPESKALEEITLLSRRTPYPAVPELGANASSEETRKHYETIKPLLDNHRAAELSRQWKHAQACETFLADYPRSTQRERIEAGWFYSLISCLKDRGELGRLAMARAEQILATPNLPASHALPFYNHQLDMIPMLGNGVTLKALGTAPAASAKVAEAINELLARFKRQYPGTPELGSLDYEAASYFSRRDKDRALELLTEADGLVTGEGTRKQIEVLRFRLTAKGREMPDISFTSLDNQPIDLRNYRGRVVLVDFWATWCSPCVAKLPEVQKLYDKYHAKGLEVVGISLDSKKEKLLSFLEERKLPWPQYFDGQGWNNKIAKQFSIHSIPDVWIIDQNGKIAAIAPDNPEAVVEELLRN